MVVTAERRIPSLSLRTNLVWAFVGTGVYGVCRWLTFAVLAKLIAADEIGRYAFATALVTPVFVLANMELRTIQATDARREHLFADYMALRTGTSAAAMAVCAIMAVFGGRGVWAVVLAVAATQAADSVSDIVYGLFQVHERIDRMARSMVLKGPARLLLLGVIVHATGSIVLGVLGECCAVVAVLVLHDVPAGTALLRSGAGRDEKGDTVLPRWRFDELRRLVGVSLPMVGLVLVLAIQAQLPRYFLEPYSGMRSLGIFATISALAGTGGPVWTALGNAATPRLAQHWAAGDPSGFRKLRWRLLGVALLLGMGGVGVAHVVGRQVLRALYAPEYAEQSGVLVWLMVAAAAGYLGSALGVSLTARRQLRPQFLVQLCVTLGCLPAYWICAKTMGLSGVAYVMCGQNALYFIAYAMLA
jgi:O-antigen/teichoic acid export membrane protein